MTVSQENVELVRRLQPRPDVDLAALFRDEGSAGGFAETFVSFFHADCQCVLHMPGAEQVTYTGLDGWRDGWRDWLEPWVSYRSEIEDLLDDGERVVVLVRDYARRVPGAPEVGQIAAAVWTVRDGKIARAEFYATRAEALEAVGRRE
jgi:ketosteroid isomerase-like protein